MSLLTPLYILGLLAVSLPLVFHLIRRMPRGQYAFSSLMFLSPSPPRLTRRSRLDNLLLLLLRAAILVLLALAFARPFLRESSRSAVDLAPGRTVAILIDTSASMSRETLWQQAVDRAEALLDDLTLGDDVALFAFDSDVKTLVGFEDLAPIDPADRIVQVRAQLAELQPTSAASNLGQALVAVAEELNEVGNVQDEATDSLRQLVLIGDCQEGSRLDALQAYQWPEDVRLIVETVAPADSTNAGLHLAAALDESVEATDQEEIRVRVANDRQSAAEEFELRWATVDGPLPEVPATSVYVPPGESRVVRVSRPEISRSADRLLLTGDSHAFDNSLYLVPIRQEEISVVYLGQDSADDTDGLRYYLERVFPETARRKIDLAAQAPDTPLSPDDLEATRLIVVGQSLPDERIAELAAHLAGGGTVFCVMTDIDHGKTVARLMDRDDLLVEEASTDGYVMLGEIAFNDPLFAPLSAPKFNDFTKIHFWHHRRVEIDDAVDNVRVLARFDNGDPALFEQTRGEGRLLVLTSGWHPSDSQLSRSSKFVPLLAGILQRSGVADAVLPQYTVNDRVATAVAGVKEIPDRVQIPDGSEIILSEELKTFDETDRPGVYRFLAGQAEQPFAVNVAPGESRTTPLDAEEFERLGARTGERQSRAELVDHRRQMRDRELEGKQKLWRWLIVVAAGLLIFETWLAGRLARPKPQGEGVSE